MNVLPNEVLSMEIECINQDNFVVLITSLDGSISSHKIEKELLTPMCELDEQLSKSVNSFLNKHSKRITA